MKRRSFFGALLGAAAVPLVKKPAEASDYNVTPKVAEPGETYVFRESDYRIWTGMGRINTCGLSGIDYVSPETVERWTKRGGF